MKGSVLEPTSIIQWNVSQGFEPAGFSEPSTSTLSQMLKVWPIDLHLLPKLPSFVGFFQPYIECLGMFF